MIGFLLRFFAQISLLLSYFFPGIIFYRITDCFVDIKEKKPFKFIAFISLASIISVVIIVSDIVNVLYALIAYICIMIICYKGSIIKRLSVVMVFYPIIVSLNLFGYKFIKGNQFLHVLIWRYLLLLFWFVISKVMKDKILYAKQYINDKTWLLIDIICVAPFISIISTIILTGHNEEFKAYIIAIVCIVSNLGVMFLIKYIIDGVKLSLDNQNYKLQYDYYKALEEKQLQIRKIHHDMNNHLQVIGTYINSNDISKAKLYFENLTKKSLSYKSKLFCKNSIVNAVLNSKYNTVIENKIDLEMNIAIDNLFFIDDMDLCSLFSNTLDNAIDASLNIEETSKRKIILKARLDKEYFSYSIINKKINNILTLKGTILSNKIDKRHHGYGLQNVKDIVNKYNGVIDIKYTDSEFSVVLIIKASS